MKTEIYKSAVLSHFKTNFYASQRSYIILKQILCKSKVIYYFKTNYYTGHRSYIILKPIII